ARRRADRLDEALLLQEPQLGVRDGGELLTEDAQDVADAHRGLPGDAPGPRIDGVSGGATRLGVASGACGARGHGAGVPAAHCAGAWGLAWNVSRNLPICTSSPVTSVAASIRPRLT